MAVASDERSSRVKFSYIDYAQTQSVQYLERDRQVKKTSKTSSVTRRRSVFHSWFFYLAFFCVAMHQLPLAQPKELELLMCKYLRYMEECSDSLLKSSKNISFNSTYCPGGFDGFLCWPHGKPGLLVSESCPNYLDYVNESSLAHRFCLGNGSWHRTWTGNDFTIWDNRDECSPLNEDELHEESEKAKNELAMLNNLGITYTVGYAISLVCLVIALVVFTYFRKLHCMRNYIHMNLMISFILRYTTVMIKDQVLKSHYNPKRFDELSEEDMKLFCDDYDGVSGHMISCRMVITLMHYTILANYFWLLAEGIYLQILLSFPMADCKENKYFPFFMAGGWGGPWIPIGIWVVLRITLENTGCWEMYEHSAILWCLTGPVIVSIAINFIIFVNIIRIIITKLRAHNLKRNDYKMTLAKSTLALIPLLGIHYIVFLFITDDMVDSNNVVMKIKISFEMVFTSIQGMLIAVFYCFLNGEVRCEVIKFWKNLRLKNGLPSNTYRKTSTYNSNGTQLTAMTYTTMEDKIQINQETSLLTPSNRCDSSKSSRRSTMTNNESKASQPEGSNFALDCNNPKSEFIPNTKDSV